MAKNKTIKNENDCLLDEGEKVWFQDFGTTQDGKKKWYAEYGTIEAVKKNGNFIVDSYFGLFELDKKDAFVSKDKCEIAIKMYKENDYYDD